MNKKREFQNKPPLSKLVLRPEMYGRQLEDVLLFWTGMPSCHPVRDRLAANISALTLAITVKKKRKKERKSKNMEVRRDYRNIHELRDQTELFENSNKNCACYVIIPVGTKCTSNRQCRLLCCVYLALPVQWAYVI